MEKDDALKLTLAVGEKLEDAGYNISYTRTTDVYDSPYQKAEKANATNADYFISFHRNFSAEDNTYNGVQSLIYPGSQSAETIGNSINEQLEDVGFANLGIEERPNLVVLRKTKMPAVLVEAGFINSDKDNEIFVKDFDQVVDAIVRGIENVIPVESPTLQKRYGVQVGLFHHYSNAEFLKEQLEGLGYDVSVRYEDPYYSVIVGSENSLEDAADLQYRLRQAGYDTLIITL